MNLEFMKKVVGGEEKGENEQGLKQHQSYVNPTLIFARCFIAATILDVRGEGRFKGVEKEKREGVR